MRAGHRREFSDRDRGVGGAKRHVRQRDRLGHIGGALRHRLGEAEARQCQTASEADAGLLRVQRIDLLFDVVFHRHEEQRLAEPHAGGDLCLEGVALRLADGLEAQGFMVSVTDATGQTRDLTSNCAGNFYVLHDDWVAAGGKRHALGGTFFEPTILTGVTPQNPLLAINPENWYFTS